MFKEINATLKPQPGHIPFIHPIEERMAWEQLDQQVKEQLVRQGEAYLNYSYPQLAATDYMDFMRTGNREAFQVKYFMRRIALNSLVLAECVEAQGRFLDDIINGIVLICEESAWQLPAHNSYIRDTPQLILPDITRPVIDLFAAETGAVLGVIRGLLSTCLEAVSPLILTMIDDNLERRIFTPYQKEQFWWMGDGTSPMNNWTVWCTQNILLAALTTCPDEKRLAAIVPKACLSTDYFLAEYGEDGCCDEGAQYYRHAGLCLFNIIELLNHVTNDAYISLYDNSKIRNIAAYIQNVHVDDIYYINFADCSPVAGRCNAREFLFGQRTQNPQLTTFAAEDYMRSENQLLADEHSLYYRLQAVFTHKQIRKYAIAAPGIASLAEYKDCFYPSVGLMIARDNTCCLAVKAGDNDDSHNHNDTGSFTLYKNGLPMFIDVGVETYTKKTFSPQRYELWPMQSAYHNLLTFGGIMQKNGAAYCARNVDITMDKEVSSITMELSAAYPNERIKTYRRNVSFVKNQVITVTDTFDCDGMAAVLSLMTYEMPVWESSCSSSTADNTRTASGTGRLQIGSLGSCHISGVKSVQIEQIPIHDKRLSEAWKHDIYRVLVTAADKEICLTIET